MKEKPNIIIDVERMRHPYTGLYYYCKNLAVNLDRYHGEKFNFHFFTYRQVKLPSFLRKNVRRKIDKVKLTRPKRYKIWHTTWQDTRYIPKNNIKFVYTIHDLNFLYTDKPESKKRKLLEQTRQRIERADAVTVISNFVKEDIEKNIDTKGKHIDVIYNGVELKEFPHFDNPRYRPQKKYLLTVGTVLLKKHFHVLPRLLPDNDYELIIAGITPDNDYVKKVEQEAKKIDVSERVKMIGPVSEEEKYWYIKNAEAFLFPSISEGFGLPPIEAMRLGKPVFLSTSTSLPEIGGDKAYYFENFEAAHMQEVLKQGLEDYYKNNRKQEIIKWSNQFTWKEAVSKYVEVYQRVLGLPINGEPDSKNKIKVTAIIPTLNEEKNIAEAISNVQWADEILVIDSFSSDKTTEIASKMNAIVLQRKFDNYSNQKNYAIEKAKNDWIFVLDADERISDDLLLEIQNKINGNIKEQAFWIPRTNYFLGKKVNYSGWQHDKVIRLFNRKFAEYNGKYVHEEIKSKAKIGHLKSPLIHYTCTDYQQYKTKIDSYAELKAKELFQKNQKPNIFHHLLKPSYRFIYHYFVQLGFLDGKIGYKIASINYYGMKKRYQVLKQLFQKKK